MWNISKIKYLYFKFWPWIFLLPVMILFFLGTSYFNYSSQTKDFIKWSSPDETANYTFTKLYAEEGRLEIAERYNILVKDIMHPRSFRVFDGVLKPMSFLGIILIYGQIAHYFGASVIPYLTPFFGSLGLLFFYLLLQEIFNRRVAFTGALVLSIFPVYFYFTSKSMFHNVLFMVLLLLSLTFLVKAAKRPFLQRNFKSLQADWLKISYYSLGGFALGLTIATRTSELLWLAPALALLYLLNWRRVAVWELLLIIACTLIALLPVGYFNVILYGAPFQSGYAEVNTTLINLTTSGNSLFREAATMNSDNILILGKKIIKTIFFFGFKPLLALQLFWKYTLVLAPWLIYGSLIGFVIWLFDYKKSKPGQVQLFIIFLLISAVLITYYGSWDFHDNPDKNAVTIGNSYTRYWLPIYLCLIAWLAVALDKLGQSARHWSLSWLFKLFFIFLFALSSKQLVFGPGQESLATSIRNGEKSQWQQERILKLTERNSVIITKYQDKLFFPERKVVYGLFNEDAMIRQYAILARRLPTYFYSFTFPKNDLQFLNKRRLPKLGLRLQEIATLDEFTLYKLISISAIQTPQTIK